MGNYFPRLIAQLVLERPRNNLINLLLKKTISMKQEDAYFFTGQLDSERCLPHLVFVFSLEGTDIYCGFNSARSRARHFTAYHL